MESYSGVPLYTRDLSFELHRQGHTAEIYTLKKGAIAQELLAAGILVTDNPSHVRIQPDIIHGQHNVSTMIAVKQFRTTPALFICHNHTFWGDGAPFHPHILLYLGVSRICMERLKRDGVPENTISFLANFVDTYRFIPRLPLPQKPSRALVFSNYANDETHLPFVRDACSQAGLHLDVVGMKTNFIENPEKILGNYDIVFAKAKAAIESMATGTAVILCDFSGVGPMVTSREFDTLRLMNFGFETLTKPFDPWNILNEISRYDPEDATKVRDRIRSEANLEAAVKNLITLYESVIKNYQDSISTGGKKNIHEPLFKLGYWERVRFWAALKLVLRYILWPIAQIDLAAKEHLFIFTRYSTISFITKKGKEKQLMLVRIWMAFPEAVRIRIQDLPIVKKLIDLIGHRIMTDQK
jgi:hypothetical protein